MRLGQSLREYCRYRRTSSADAVVKWGEGLSHGRSSKIGEIAKGVLSVQKNRRTSSTDAVVKWGEEWSHGRSSKIGEIAKGVLLVQKNIQH